MKIKITHLATGQSRIMDNTVEADMRGMENLTFELCGAGQNTRATANAMLDGQALREGVLPFTRNGVRFERAE